MGSDGFILLCSSNKAHFRIRIFNPDGGETPFCGNGARCAAKFAFMKVIAGHRMTIETQAGVISAEVLPDGGASVEVPGDREEPRRLSIALEGRSIPGLLVHTGVPHFVVIVKDIESIPVQKLGRMMRNAPEFGAEGANIDFVSMVSGEPFPMRTYERGLERESLACGTGATAVAWVLYKLGRADRSVTLGMRSRKELHVAIAAPTSPPPLFRLAGEARVVYRGTLSGSSMEEALRCS